MGVCSFLAQCYLIIYNTVFVIAGMVASYRGVYLHLSANNYRREHPILAVVVPFDKPIENVAMKFLIPGCIMLFVSCSGCCGAFSNKRNLLALYCICMIILIAAEIYSMSSASKSLFSYLQSDLFVYQIELIMFGGGNIYPELGLQILALLAAAYVWYYIGEEKKEENITIQYTSTNVRIRSDSDSS